MAKETSRRLAQYLQAHTDGRLRSVVHYTPDDYELVYLRDDVEELYSGEELESVADQLRIENLERGQMEELYVHGGLNCSIRCFQKGVEMHFPHRKAEGTAVGLDPQATEELYAFIGDCLTFLRS